MVRNAQIIAGSSLVIALSNPRKRGGGGTGHGLRVAEHLMLPRIDWRGLSRTSGKSLSWISSLPFRKKKSSSCSRGANFFPTKMLTERKDTATVLAQ